MKTLRITLLMLLMISSETLAGREYKIFDTKTGTELDVEELAESSVAFDIMFFGEFHDDSLIHAIQAEYLEEMYDEYDENLSISMEMFERDVQEHINMYLADEIKEEQFLKNSRPWPSYKTDYRALVELAKDNDSYVIAANVPRKYASMFARGGNTSFNSLTAEERAYIAKDIELTQDDYMTQFYKTMIGGFGKKELSELDLNENNTLHLFYGAQIVKDETMAESMVDYLQKNKGKKLIHFNGNFHSSSGLGTVAKVRTRNQIIKCGVISPAYIKAGEEIKFSDEYKSDGDYIILLHEKPPKMYQDMMSAHMGGNYINSHDITISLDLEKNFIKGKDVIKFKAPIITGASLKLLKDLKVTNVTSVDCNVQWQNIEKDDELELIIKPRNCEITNLEIEYEGVVYNKPNERNLKQKHAYSSGMISNKEGEGVYLPAGSFYPYTNLDMADFKVTMTYNNDIKIITSGLLESSNVDGNMRTDVFKTEIAADNLTLVGGKYTQKDTVYDGKTFSLLLLSPSRAAGSYLNSMIEYYQEYTKLFGEYPYSNFTLVENFFATGFGMPGYTLLSGRLLQMPWVVLSPGSLAHEFVHNWWGNSVYIKPNAGNWCEGLTTFSSNYYYHVIKENDAKALDWRKKALISIENLPEENSYPLKDFKYQANTDDAVIGYSKGGFLFYELYKIMGEQHFFDALKGFAKKYKGRRVTWFFMKMNFSGYARRSKLDAPVMTIFNQWLNSSDVPEFSIADANQTDSTLNLTINQSGKFYTHLPIKIEYEDNIEWKNIVVEGSETKVEISNPAKVKKVQIDPEYQALRQLNYWEIPYTFNSTLNDSALVVIPATDSPQHKVAKDFVDLLNESGYSVESIACNEIKDADWNNRSVIVLGNEKNNSFFKQFDGKLPGGVSLEAEKLDVDGKSFDFNDNLLILNYTHPKNYKKAATIISYSELKDVEQLRRLFHYMSYSMLMINKNKMGRPLVSKELFPEVPEENPLTWTNK